MVVEGWNGTRRLLKTVNSEKHILQGIRRHSYVLHVLEKSKSV